MKKTIQLMMALISSAVFNKELRKEYCEPISLETGKALYAISNKHDLAHVVAYAIVKNNIEIDEEIEKLFKLKMFSAVSRYEVQKHELSVLTTKLEEMKVDFVLLKGATLNKLYPEPWLRTSCDIDILVNKNSLETITKALCDELHYAQKATTGHDVNFISPSKVHLELHYRLVENNHLKNAEISLNKLWNYTRNVSGYTYQKEFLDDFLYYYHILHMAKHFEVGGCGIKPFIDLYLLDNQKNGDTSKRVDILRTNSLLKFTENCQLLNKKWFEDDCSNNTIDRMEKFILTGGVYGTLKNHVIIQQTKKGNKSKYLLSRVFFKYDKIKYQFPKLGKYRILTPLMNVIRWFKLIFASRRKKASNEIKYSNMLTKNEIKETKNFLKEIGLNLLWETTADTKQS